MGVLKCVCECVHECVRVNACPALRIRLCCACVFISGVCYEANCPGTYGGTQQTVLIHLVNVSTMQNFGLRSYVRLAADSIMLVCYPSCKQMYCAGICHGLHDGDALAIRCCQPCVGVGPSRSRICSANYHQ